MRHKTLIEKLGGLAHELVGAVLFREHSAYDELVRDIDGRLHAAWAMFGAPISPREWLDGMDPSPEEMEMFNRDEWIQAVRERETVLGWTEWLCHQIEDYRADPNRGD